MHQRTFLSWFTHMALLRGGTEWNCSNLLCKHSRAVWRCVCLSVCVCGCVYKPPRGKTGAVSHHSSLPHEDTAGRSSSVSHSTPSRPPLCFLSLRVHQARSASGPSLFWCLSASSLKVIRPSDVFLLFFSTSILKAWLDFYLQPVVFMLVNLCVQHLALCIPWCWWEDSFSSSVNTSKIFELQQCLNLTWQLDRQDFSSEISLVRVGKL